MRLEAFLRLERGDLVVHDRAQSTMGLVVGNQEEGELRIRHVYVVWEDGERERYSHNDAPKIWPWRTS